MTAYEQYIDYINRFEQNGKTVNEFKAEYERLCEYEMQLKMHEPNKTLKARPQNVRFGVAVSRP